jgi:predicted  nucleic acid-binding Zn-ribbon protein
MPTSIDPQPAEDEFECARCGAYFYYELTRCPNCGVNIFEPEDWNENEHLASEPSSSHGKGLISSLSDLLRNLFPGTQREYEAREETKEQDELYEDLLLRVRGDRDIAERLIAFEKRHSPNGNLTMWLRDAIRRWQRDNR